MIIEKKTFINTNIEDFFGVSLNTLLLPISKDSIAGSDLRFSDLYRQIKGARENESSSLPNGPWSHDLGKADWQKVAKLSLNALENTSKDLQIATWLFEAQLHLQGFKALKPNLFLIRKLCETFWNDMYPRKNIDGYEQRSNLFRWIDDVLSSVLWDTPLTDPSTASNAYSLKAYEMALNADMIRQKHNGPSENMYNQDLTLSDIETAAQSTSNEFYESILGQISETKDELQELSDLLEKLYDNESPIFFTFNELLERISFVINYKFKCGSLAITF